MRNDSIHISRVSKVERANGAEGILEEIMAKNIPKVMKDIYLQIQYVL